MLDRKQIGKRLKGVNTGLCIAFAARCTLRVLPLLVADYDSEAFGYWPENDISESLMSVLVAQQLCVNYSSGSEKFRDIDHEALFRALRVGDITDGTSSDVLQAVAAASAAAATSEAFGDSSMYTLNAAESSVFAVSAYTGVFKDGKKLIREIKKDLEKISEVKFCSSAVENQAHYELFSSPLWSEEPPEDWNKIFTHFKKALFDLDGGFEIWIDWYDDRLTGKPFEYEREHLWSNVPPEILEQGAKATNSYLASFDVAELAPLNLVRAIFIGDGAVGKTSLIRRIHGESIIEGMEVMTPGIDIKQWSLPDSDIKARFWDFGGQVMSHSMHQFFLRERCLYILLVDAGSEKEKREFTTANDRAEYWLEHIKAFGNSAPVMLVGNKAEKEKVNLDMNALREKYPNIIDFYPISCTSHEITYLRRFDVFQQDLIRQLNEVDTHQVMFTPNQFKMLEQLRDQSRKQAFLDHSVFDDLCEQHEIGKVGLDQSAFLGLLDSLGEIIHFPDLAWSEAYVLNPRWLTYGVYTLLYAEKTETQSGLLSDADVIDILQSQKVEDELGNVLKYPKGKCRFIVDAMVSFGLCYQVVAKTNKDEGYLVIPDRLPKNQPDLSLYFPETEDVLAFEFDFDGLLPRSLMPNLIVSRHVEILEANDGNQLVWQRGVILGNPSSKSKARLQVDYTQRRLQLWAQGDGLREYLSVLRDEIHQLLEPIKGLSFVENVVLPSFARVSSQRDLFTTLTKKEIAPYLRLRAEFNKGQSVTFSDLGTGYYLRKIMGVIMTNEQQQKAGMNIIVNGSVGAIGGSGDNQRIRGRIKLSSSDKQLMYEFQSAISALMEHIENYETAFKIKASAYGELEKIRECLETPELVSPVDKSKVLLALESIRDGSLGAVKLGTKIRDADETISWLMAKAATMSALLSGIPA